MIIGDLSAFGYELWGQPPPPPDPPATQLIAGINPATIPAAYDLWGGVQIPSVAQPKGTPAGDPTLGVILDFLFAWLVTDGNATAAWAPVYPASPPIKQRYQHNPADVVFNTTALPALYMWRENATQDRFGDDWLRETTQVKALWVFPLQGDQEQQRLRVSFVNTLAKAIAVGIERGRTPSYIIPGDLERRARREGSLFYSAANFERFRLKAWKPAKLQIQGATGGAIAYPGLELTFELWEVLELGLGRFPVAGGAFATLVNEAGVVVDAGPLP